MVLVPLHSEHATARPLNLLLFEMSVLFKMADKSLRVELAIVSLLEHNLNQQILHFRSFNSTCNKSFGSFTLKSDTPLPNVR